MSSEMKLHHNGLKEMIKDLRWTGTLRDDLEREVGEIHIKFKDELRGPSLSAPGDKWPVGLIHNRGRRNEWYGPGGQLSGRSLRKWRAKQSGLSLLEINDAKSGRGVRYAEHVHFKGGDPGDAEALAYAEFVEIANEQTEVMAQIIEEHIDGRG